MANIEGKIGGKVRFCLAKSWVGGVRVKKVVTSFPDLLDNLAYWTPMTFDSIFIAASVLSRQIQIKGL